MHITWNTGGAAVVFFLVFQLGAHIPKQGGLGPPPLLTPWTIYVCLQHLLSGYFNTYFGHFSQIRAASFFILIRGAIMTRRNSSAQIVYSTKQAKQLIRDGLLLIK